MLQRFLLGCSALLVWVAFQTGCVRCASGEVKDGNRCVRPCNTRADCAGQETCQDGKCLVVDGTEGSSSSGNAGSSDGSSGMQSSSGSASSSSGGAMMAQVPCAGTVFTGSTYRMCGGFQAAPVVMEGASHRMRVNLDGARPSGTLSGGNVVLRAGGIP